MVCIDSRSKIQQQKVPIVQLAALSELLGNTEIEAICHELGHHWRDRRLPPGVTVRSIVYRGLHPDHSIKATLADMAAADPEMEEAPSDASWCDARSRLPQALLPQLVRRSAQGLQKRVGKKHLYRGRPVYYFDGSSVSMPDTPELVEAFGYANTKHGPSWFPTARIAFLTLAGVEAVVTGRNASSHAWSNAIGEDALYRHGDRMEAVTSAEMVVGPRGELRLYNTLKIQR